MSAYEALAGVYDALTGDVGYERRAIWRSSSGAAGFLSAPCWTWPAAPGR